MHQREVSGRILLPLRDRSRPISSAVCCLRSGRLVYFYHHHQLQVPTVCTCASYVLRSLHREMVSVALLVLPASQVECGAWRVPYRTVSPASACV